MTVKKEEEEEEEEEEEKKMWKKNSLSPLYRTGPCRL
jgi:hypothetical protein